MDYRDFDSIFVPPTGYVDLYSLKVGEFFMEDTYPDVYEVKKIVVKDHLGEKSLKVVECWNITDNTPCDFYYNTAYSAYAPCLVKLVQIKSEEIKEIENTIFQKFGEKVKVYFGEIDNLGNWFYFERSFFGKYRLGTTLHNAVAMVGYMESLPSDTILIK